MLPTLLHTHPTMGHAPTPPWVTPPMHHGSPPQCTMGHAPNAPWVMHPPHHGSRPQCTMGHAPNAPWVMLPLHHNIVPCNPQATFSFDAVCGSMTCRMSSTSWPTAFPTAPRSITKLRGTFEDTSSWGTWVRFFRCMHACTHKTHESLRQVSVQCRVQGRAVLDSSLQLQTYPLPHGAGSRKITKCNANDSARHSSLSEVRPIRLLQHTWPAEHVDQ